MSEPLKGGFGSFTAETPFKPSGSTGTTQPTSVFGNPAPAANTGTNTQATSAPSAFGGTGGTGSLFGGPKPATGSLFGGGTAGTTTTGTAPSATPVTGGGGSGLFGFGATSATPPAGQNASPAPTAPATSAFGGGNLFGAKPADQSANAGAAGAPAAPKPTTGLFGTTTGNAAGTQSAPATTSTTPSLFGKPADAGTSTPAPAPTAPAGGSIFGTNLFGKKPDTPSNANATTSSTPAAPATTSLFSGFGAKKDDAADKDKDKAPTPAAPTGVLFGQAAANKDAPAAGATGSGFSLFGQKPAEKKDAPAEGEKKDATGAPVTTGLGTSSLAKPAGSGTPTPAGISVPPPSMLRGKTIEEIVNKWSSELETHVREFNRLAGEIAVWDRSLVDNGNTIAALFQHVLMAEREQSDIEQSLKLVEDQQKELGATLEVYEKAAGEIFEGQGGGLRALDVGPADAERDKHYTLAADLNSNLDDLSRSLMQMIESVNALSESPDGTIGGEGEVAKVKDEAPLEQIAQILSKHLESLQWIDGAVREVDSKVTEVERLVRDASANGSRNSSAASSLAGSVNGTSGLTGSRGFGLR
ncbi:uncharacterized protein FOMMEDRAFT_147787 [Fomitiporia mediterranea MF3/22]|uniref:uncharacterized protein n=1 Tax=Fomitiporia mediterranea (strain MF3/22) TaxID=694068 RepID=UPI0004407B71|nr:uncharacterized protein FOMMEDRAFT_147787 [Fomitiporia mediterranea MF3/22]EJD01180.1 hypothetical protein FOMMEDRAFT_147787 [Fomitiporia mediterranea MF3/22]